MKRSSIFLFFTVLAVMAISTSCTAYKGVAYLQDSQKFETKEIATEMYDARIMPKDLISITVSTTDPEASIPFNLTVPSTLTTQNKYLTSQPSLQQYLVENDGTIDFPVIGEITIGGLTKSETEALIKDKLKEYLKEEPIVNVRMTNYKISVLGEVSRPGTFTISNEKVNIFEALAMAGDLTVYGLRDNVKLIREDANGVRKVVELNLNNSDVIASPYYYLQQNDLVYITPNETRSRDADISTSKTIWLSITGTLVSVATLVVSLIKL